MKFYYGDLYGNILYGGRDEDEDEPVSVWDETGTIITITEDE